MIFQITCVIIGFIIILISNFIISPISGLLGAIFNLIGAIIAIIPPFLFFYLKHRKNKEIESQFLTFILDLTESIDSGMTLPMALKHCSKRDYKSLTPYIKRMAAQIDWGVPFEKIFEIFAEDVSSITVKRAIATIIETYRVGGELSTTLKSINKSLTEINKIKEERTASVHEQLITSYIVFFIFIFILVVLQNYLIPALTVEGGVNIGFGAGGGQAISAETYYQTFIVFIIIQGFFAGLVAGKMAEGSMIGGIKHSIILITAGYALFSIATQLEIKIL